MSEGLRIPHMEHSDIGRAGESSPPLFMEHRWGERIPCRARVRLSSETRVGNGRIRDVSASGAFIETALDLPECAPVTLFVLGNESATRIVEVCAIVVRSARDGIAVEWCDTPALSICTILGCSVRCAYLGSRPCLPAGA